MRVLDAVKDVACPLKSNTDSGLEHLGMCRLCSALQGSCDYFYSGDLVLLEKSPPDFCSKVRNLSTGTLGMDMSRGYLTHS